MGEFADEFRPGLHLLTPRERECLRLVDEHLSSKQIARRLGISKYTVDSHIDHARQRLGVDTRYAAARLVALQERAADAAVSDVARLPTASGGDAVGIGKPRFPWPDQASQGDRDERSDQDTVAEAIKTGAETGAVRAEGVSPRSKRGANGSSDSLPGRPSSRSAGAGGSGGGPGFHLDGAGTAAVATGGDALAAGVGEDPGVRHPQAGGVQAFGPGAARNPLHRLGADGRRFSSRLGPLGFSVGGGRNDLSLLQRLGYMLAIVIASALSFGAVLAGLHALKDLV